MMVMMTMMMKTPNGHNSANFEATTSRLFMLIIRSNWHLGDDDDHDVTVIDYNDDDVNDDESPKWP